MKNNRFRIFVINPGSTSTKLALFENNIKILETSVTHDAEVLNSFPMPNDQLEYRMGVIKEFVEKNDIELDNIDAFVGRGGGCRPVPSGTFEVNDILLQDIRNNVGRTIHPSILGVQLAYELQQKYGGRLFMVDPICVDEYTDVARVTGVKGIERRAESHALNLRGTAMKHCKIHGMDYYSSSLVVAHIDGGITIAAHKNGKQIDCNQGAGGEGPFTATRTGSLPLMEVLDYNAYDLKFISEDDITYNPALGTGQIQIKDIHYITCEYRTTWQMCQLLDRKYLNSSRRSIDDFYREAKRNQWIKE